MSSRKRGDAKKALRQTQDLNSKKIFPNIFFEIFVQIQEVEPILVFDKFSIASFSLLGKSVKEIHHKNKLKKEKSYERGQHYVVRCTAGLFLVLRIQK